MLLQLYAGCLAISGAIAAPTTPDTPFTGGILRVTVAPPATTTSTPLSTGDCDTKGPLNQTGSHLFVNYDLVPPKSYFVPCSSFLSDYYPKTKSSTTVPTKTRTFISLVDCASLIYNNQTLTGSTKAVFNHDGRFSTTTQACTDWASSSMSFEKSPEGTAAALYSACQSQAVRIDVEKDPSFTGVTGSVVAQVYPGSLLGSSYSSYRNSTSFPIKYSTENPPGGRITTMPCASFQAAYMPGYKSIDSSYESWMSSVTSFWRSPQCTSQAKAMNVSSRHGLPKRQIQYQEWDGDLGVPFGPGKVVHQVGLGGNSATCCGPCQVVAQTLSMLYWPKGSTTPVCTGGSITSLATLSQTSDLAARGMTYANGSSHSQYNGSSQYAIVNGSTLTSPSVYLEFQGTVWVSDLCGTLGSALTSLTIAVRPEMVSSIVFGTGEDQFTNKPFDFDACPTFGWSDPFYTSFEDSNNPGSYLEAYLTSTIGPPYHPIVSQVPELFVAQPAYSQCSAWRSVGYRAEPFYGAFDPPRTLKPVDALTAPTPSAVIAEPDFTSSATPQQTASVDSPKVTASFSPEALPDLRPQQNSESVIDGARPWWAIHTPSDPSELDPMGKASKPTLERLSSQSEDQSIASDDLKHSDKPQADPQPTPTSLNSQSKNVLSTTRSPVNSAVSSVDRPSGQDIESSVSNNEGSNVFQSIGAVTVHRQTEDAITQVNDMTSQLSLSDGSSIAAASSTQKLAPSGTKDAEVLVMTFAGSTYSLDSSSNLMIQGHTLTPGGAMIVKGTTIAYGSSDNDIVIGTSTQKLALTKIENAQGPLMTLAGSTYSVDASSNLIIQSQSLTPDGVITIQGTTIAYGSNGNEVFIGTSTQALGGADTTPLPVFTVGDSTFTADDASPVVIDGQTLSRGGEITVSGAPVSFAAAGTNVVVGSSTQAVHLGSYIMDGFGPGSSTGDGSTGGNATASPTPFTGDQPRRERDFWLLVCSMTFAIAISILNIAM